MLHIVERRHGADPIAQGWMGGHIVHALPIDPHLPWVLLESLDVCFAGTCGHGASSLPSIMGAILGDPGRLRRSAAWHTARESANGQHTRPAFEPGAPLCYCVTIIRRGKSSPHTERPYGSWHHCPVTRLHAQSGG